MSERPKNWQHETPWEDDPLPPKWRFRERRRWRIRMLNRPSANMAVWNKWRVANGITPVPDPPLYWWTDKPQARPTHD